MTTQDFKDYPQRVWINSPSTLQPYHKFHGKVGIGVIDSHDKTGETISVYFTEGEMHSMIVNPLYLAKAK